MRTLEQKVEHYNGLLDVAYNATQRANRKIAEVEERKASALLYAENNVACAERGLATTNFNLEAERNILTRIEARAVEDAEARANGCVVAVKDYEASVVKAKEAHEASVVKAKEAHEASVVKAKEAHEASIAKIRGSREPAVSPRIAQLRFSISRLEREREAADSKLIAAKAIAATTIERYDVLVANATAAHKAAVFRQSDAQDNYNFASSSVEFRDRKETLEMLRRFENQRAGEQERAKASGIATTQYKVDTRSMVEIEAAEEEENAKRAYLAQEAGGIVTTQHKVDDRSIVKIEDAEEDECKPVRFFDTA